MTESSTLRKILNKSTTRCYYLFILTILLSTTDSQIRWYYKDEFEEITFNPHTHHTFYLLNSIRLVSMVACLVAIVYTHIWY